MNECMYNTTDSESYLLFYFALNNLCVKQKFNNNFKFYCIDNCIDK